MAEIQESGQLERVSHNAVMNGNASYLMSHSWENDERGDGMPERRCRPCGAYELAGMAGMGLDFGPLFTSRSEYPPYCRARSVSKAISTGTHVSVDRVLVQDALKARETNASLSNVNQIIERASRILIIGILEKFRYEIVPRPAGLTNKEVTAEMHKFYDDRFTRDDVSKALAELCKRNSAEKNPGSYFRTAEYEGHHSVVRFYKETR